MTYRVKGFSCVTCAVGLDTILQKKNGVIWYQSKYLDGTVLIKFDPDVITDSSLQACITEMGFIVEDAAN